MPAWLATLPSRGRASAKRLPSLCMAATLLLATLASPVASFAQSQTDPRMFAQTGYRIDRDSFWDYFGHRGGVTTFGYPVSRDFQFEGCTSQFFQRLVMQQCGTQGVGTMNLLDDGLLPYTRMNGSTFPPRMTSPWRPRRWAPRTTPPPCSTTCAGLPGYLRRPAGQVPEHVLQHDQPGCRRYERSEHPRPARSRDLGRPDLHAGLRSVEPQLHLPALPARHHALRQDVRLHAGPAAGRLPEGACSPATTCPATWPRRPPSPCCEPR